MNDQKIFDLLLEVMKLLQETNRRVDRIETNLINLIEAEGIKWEK